MVASALAVLSSWLVLLWLYYRHGATAPIGDNEWRIENGRRPFELLAAALENPTPAQYHRLWFIGLGFLVTGALFHVRSLFVWWPLHPVGFALAHAGYSLPWVWFPTLLGWAAKGLLLRYGGIRLYRQSIPVFLGLIFGDAFMICFWSLVGIVLDTPIYLFFPG